MSTQLHQSAIIYDATDRFLSRSYNTIKTHKLVSYIACSGYNADENYTQFILALNDGRCLLFRYRRDYDQAEKLFIVAAIKLLRYAESTGDFPISVLGRMLVKATDRLE